MGHCEAADCLTVAGAVATIVREKELRLREGMRILGLKVWRCRPFLCFQRALTQQALFSGADERCMA